MSLIGQLVDATADSLDGAALPLSFQAQKAYVPREFGLEELTELRVTVVPHGRQTQWVSRGRTPLDELSIDIGVQQKVAGDADVEILLTLVDAIAENFRTQAFAGGVACVGFSNDPIYNPEHMKQLKVFTSVITLLFKRVE